jgi:flagellar hook-associated protein FlgK
VPRYFFDIEDGARTFVDKEGTELDDVEDARDEALETLGEIAKDKLPENDRRDFVLTVREGGRKVLTATLSLRVHRELPD